MKKLLLGVLLIVFMSSCKEGFKEQMITENSYVPLEYHDSTKWIKAEIYYSPDIMYVKTGHDTYRVTSNHSAGFWVGFGFVCLFVFWTCNLI